MEHAELLRKVVEVLEGMRVAYLVTGSTATIYYGEPRFTNDIDVVIRLPAARVNEFCRAFASDEFYLDEESVRTAVASSGQFNLIHATGGLKVDFIAAGASAFDQSRFRRGVRVQAGPEYEATFASPEDVIIKKLEYYVAGGSEKHLRDIAGVLKISGERVDRTYISEWAARLGLVEVWEAVLGRVGEQR